MALLARCNLSLSGCLLALDFSHDFRIWTRGWSISLLHLLLEPLGICLNHIANLTQSIPVLLDPLLLLWVLGKDLNVLADLGNHILQAHDFLFGSHATRLLIRCTVIPKACNNVSTYSM